MYFRSKTIADWFSTVYMETNWIIKNKTDYNQTFYAGNTLLSIILHKTCSNNIKHIILYFTHSGKGNFFPLLSFFMITFYMLIY